MYGAKAVDPLPTLGAPCRARRGGAFTFRGTPIAVDGGTGGFGTVAVVAAVVLIKAAGGIFPELFALLPLVF